MEVQTGTPPEDGRYVAFVQCASLQISDWCEPVILSYHSGSWQYMWPVFGWIGPLQPVKWQTLLDREQEYDL